MNVLLTIRWPTSDCVVRWKKRGKSKSRILGNHEAKNNRLKKTQGGDIGEQSHEDVSCGTLGCFRKPRARLIS